MSISTLIQYRFNDLKFELKDEQKLHKFTRNRRLCRRCGPRHERNLRLQV